MSCCIVGVCVPGHCALQWHIQSCSCLTRIYPLAVSCILIFLSVCVPQVLPCAMRCCYMLLCCAGSGVRALAPVCKPPASPDATAHVRLGQGGLCGLKQRGTHNQQQQQQGSAGWWGTAQVVFGVNTRPQQQMSPAGAAPATAGAGSGGSGGRLGASPLASPKKITNPETGREVAIGGAKYKELLSRGYVADLLRNTLLPPPSPGPGAAAAGRAGAPVASPAANLRHRALGTPQ